MRSWVLAFALGALATVTGAVAAAPTIDIRAQTSISLESVKVRDEGVVEVAGHLVDRLTGDGLGGQRVSISIAGTTVIAPTQPDGKFRALVGAPPGPTTVEMAFRGGPLLEGTQQISTADPTRTEVLLSIVIDDTLQTEPTITVRAETEDKAQLPIKISVGAATGATLTPLRTIASGTPFTLTRAEAGGVGSKRLRAEFVGDETRQAATSEATFELSASTTTTMQVSTTRLAYEDDLVITGHVLDEDGKPLRRAAVTLASGERRLAQGATGETGAYRFSIEGEIIGEGQYAVQVQAEPASGAYFASRSEPAIIRIVAPQPVPVIYTIAAFIATSLAAGGFFLARAKPWTKLRRPAPAAEVPANASPSDIPDGGLVSNRPTVISTLRRASDEGFAGVVRDTVRSRPVPEAVVSLVLDDAERSIRTAVDGSFALEQLAPGEWRAEVAAPGHVTERFAVSIPHRGELRGVRIDLVPVRERVFQLYRHAAEPVLPEARLWGIWSPRQIVDHVRSKQRSPAMSDLTDFVEEIYFSPRLAIESVLVQAKDHVDHAIVERAIAIGGPAKPPRPGGG